MATFKGEYDHSVDSKGRVSFPAKLRKYLDPSAQEKFTILRGLEKCLYLYPEDRWGNVEEKLLSKNQFSSRNRKVIRNFLRTADDVSLDNQNRIALPAKLMELAGISSRAIFIGSGDRIEIWSPEALEEEDSNLDFESYQDLFEEVMGDKDEE